jgi:hypothetical protein
LEGKGKDGLEERYLQGASGWLARTTAGYNPTVAAASDVRLERAKYDLDVNADRRRDSLSEIKQLLKQKAPHLREVAKSTQSLRHSYPSVDVAESIYSEADRVSVHSSSDLTIPSSELEFDFDDIVVDSAAYRRAMTAARYQGPNFQQNEARRDLVASSHDLPMCQEAKEESFEQPKPSENFESLRLPIAVLYS